MENKNVKKSNRGGKRVGAGRKGTTVKQYVVYAPKDVSDIIENAESPYSKFICECIRHWKRTH